MKNKGILISHEAAAKLAGVTRQGIEKLRATRSFFTKAGKVDTSHPDWISYLKEKTAKKTRRAIVEQIRNSPDNGDDFDFQNFKPTTIQEEKIYADILQRKVQLMQDLDLLIEKKIVSNVFGELSKQVQSNFVDLGRRISPRIAAKLKMPGTEKIIEIIINEEVKKGIVNVIKSTQKAIENL